MSYMRKEKLYAEIANPYDHHFNQFIEAAKVGELKDVISYCKSYPNNINLADSSGLTAVMYAANYGHYNILKPLVTERQAITNFREPKTDKTALMFAASNGHTRCIETLLQGKADKDLKDAQGNNAAYYATHYGHGNNKIIARLLSIQFPNQSYQQSGSSHSKHHHHHHQSTSAFNNSIEASNMSFQPHQERYNALIAQNQSLTEENLNYFSSNNSNTENYNNGRRFSVEINQNSLNEILNRTPQKPRPIFKSRQRRLSPNTHGHAQMMEINKERQRRHLYSLNQMNQFNHANTLNQMNNNQQTSYNQQQCNSPLNEVRNNLKNFSFDFDKNCLSGLSLNGNPSSPNAKNYSNDQIFNLQKTNSYYQMQNDSGFEPLQDSNNNDTNLSPASFKDRSKIDPNYFNVELLLNGTIDNGNLNRGRPRNSTFISNANSSGNSNHQSDSEHSSQESDDSLKDFENEERFSGFVIGIEDFLKKYELEHFVDLFVGKNIDLFTFLSLKETDLKEFGISNPDDLASIIASQLNYQELIGISSAKGMNFCIYLTNKLEKVKRELNRSKKEMTLMRMSLDESKNSRKNFL